MSLAIDTDSVIAVLLADGWHEVAEKSFGLDAYEFREGDRFVQGVPSTGAEWTGANGEKIACPLTAILAVKLS